MMRLVSVFRAEVQCTGKITRAGSRKVASAHSSRGPCQAQNRRKRVKEAPSRIRWVNKGSRKTLFHAFMAG